MSFAKGTTVAVRKTKAELEELLEKHRATKYSVGVDDAASVAVVYFCIDKREIVMRLKLPRPGDVKLVRKPPRQSRAEGERRAIEQLQRERWRALLLIIRAKLEAIALGASTLEREFLADLVLPGGRTVGDALLPALEAGTLPPLLGMPDQGG